MDNYNYSQVSTGQSSQQFAEEMSGPALDEEQLKVLRNAYNYAKRRSQCSAGELFILLLQYCYEWNDEHNPPAPDPATAKYATKQELTEVTQKLEKLDERVGKLEQKMDKKFDKMDKKFDKIDKKFDNLERKLDGLVGLVGPIASTPRFARSNTSIEEDSKPKEIASSTFQVQLGKYVRQRKLPKK